MKEGKLAYSVRGWSLGWELGKDCEFQHSVSVLALHSLTEALRLFLEAFKISQKDSTPSIQPGISEDSLKIELRSALYSSSAPTSLEKTIVTLPQCGVLWREGGLMTADDEPAKEQEKGK